MQETSGPRIEETGNYASATAHHVHREHDDDTLYDPYRATCSSYLTSTTSRLPLAPLTALPFSYSLLILMPDTIPLAAAPPPALQLHAWAALPAPVFFGKSRKGGPARQRWTPLPRKPRR